MSALYQKIVFFFKYLLYKKNIISMKKCSTRDHILNKPSHLLHGAASTHLLSLSIFVKKKHVKDRFKHEW